MDWTRMVLERLQLLLIHQTDPDHSPQPLNPETPTSNHVISTLFVHETLIILG